MDWLMFAAGLVAGSVLTWLRLRWRIRVLRKVIQTEKVWIKRLGEVAEECRAEAAVLLEELGRLQKK